jgi:hypothetical protein
VDHRVYDGYLVGHPCFPRMSGGPVFDVEGKVRGLAAATVTRTEPGLNGDSTVVKNGIVLDREHIRASLSRTGPLLALSIEDPSAPYIRPRLCHAAAYVGGFGDDGVRALTQVNGGQLSFQAAMNRWIAAIRSATVGDHGFLAGRTLVGFGWPGLLSVLWLIGHCSRVTRRCSDA